MEIQCVTYSAAVIEEDSEGVEISPISHPAPTLPVLQISIPLPRLKLRGLLRTLECQLKLPTFHSNVLMINEGKKHTPSIQSQQSSRDHCGVNKTGGEMRRAGNWGPGVQSPLCH